MTPFRAVPATLLTALLLAALPAPPASAQVNVEANIADILYDDVPPDDTSCGDTINFIVTIGGDTNRGDLLDAFLEIPVPAGTELTNFINAANPNDTTVILSGDNPTDRVIRVDYGTICSTQATCTQLGATLQFFLEIQDPNLFTSFSLQGTLSGSNFPDTLTDHLGDSLPDSPVVRTFDPCPPPAPARLDATKRDTLVTDLDGDGLVDAGDTVRYDVVIRNIGDEPGGVLFRSDAPAHTTFAPDSVVTPPGSRVRAGNDPTDTSVVVDLLALAGGEAHRMSFDVVVDTPVPAGVDTLSCQGGVSVSGKVGITPTDDPDTGFRDDPTITPLDFDPDLAIAKQPVPTTVPAGDLLAWDLDVGNLGRSPSGPVTVTETVPPHTTFHAAGSDPAWSCPDGAPPGTACTLTRPPIAVGTTVPITFTVRVDPTLPTGAETTENTATVNDDGTLGPDTTPRNNSTTATATLAAAPELTVTKTGPPSARPGDTVTYRITYANPGTQDATGIEITDTVPTHTTFHAAASTPGWSCPDGAPAGTPCTLTRATLPAGATRTVAFAVTLAPTVPADLQSVRNTVTLHRDPGDDPPSGPDPEDETETPVDAPADLALTKTGPPSAATGTLVTYTLTITNTGTRDTADLTLRDTVPTPATFDAAASTAGWSCPDGAAAGTECTLTLPGLAAGSATTATFAVHLPDTLPAGVEALHNRADVTSTTPDPDPSDNSATATTTLLAAPDLTVTKSDGDAAVLPGGPVTYTLTLANTGTQDATGVTLTDTLPPDTTFQARASTDGWSCTPATPTTCTFTLPGLAAGTTPLDLSLTLQTAPDLPPDLTEIVNHATVTDDGTGGPDLDPSDNSTTETTPVERHGGPPPDRGVLAATLTDQLLFDPDDDGRADPGDILTYVTLVESRGPADAREISLVLPLDPLTTLIPGSVTLTRGELTHTADHHLEIALGTLPVGESATITFEADVSDLPPGTPHLSAQGDLTASNTASTRTDDPDTPTPLDPTLTPVDDGPTEPPPRIEDIPTLGEWGLILLALGLLALTFHRLRPAGQGRAR